MRSILSGLRFQVSGFLLLLCSSIAQPTPTPTNASVSANKTTGTLAGNAYTAAQFRDANDIAQASATQPLNSRLTALGQPGVVPFSDGAYAQDSAKIARALRRWHVAAGSYSSAKVDVVALGDSITAGYGLLTQQAWPRLLQSALQRDYPVSGVVGGSGYYSTQQAVLTPGDWPVAVSGGSFSDGDGLARKSTLISGSNTITFSSPAATSVDIFYYRSGGSGSFSYSIDGGAPVTVSATGATQGFTSVRLSGLGGTTHTIALAVVSGVVIIDGFKVYNGDESVGMHVWEAGRSSVTATTLTGGSTWFRAFNVIQPAAVLIELGCNDALGVNPPNSVATYKAALQQIIANIRAQVTVSPSIILIPVWQISPQPGVTPVAPWADYIAAMYEVAAADADICVFDPRAHFNLTTTPSTAGGLLSDTAHPSVSGSRLLAGLLQRFLAAPAR